MLERRCPTCKISFPLTDEFYHRNKANVAGHNVYCKPCWRAKVRRSADRNREKYTATMAAGISIATREFSNCPCCKQTFARTLENFNSHKSYADGLQIYCRTCQRAKVKAWQAANPDKRNDWLANNKPKMAESRRKYRAKCWEAILVNAAIKATNMRGHEPVGVNRAFILDLFEQQNGLCHWFGIPMIPTASARDPQRPSLDRLDNAKGYTKDNVVLACAAANIGRSSATVERFTEFCKLLRAK